MSHQPTQLLGLNIEHGKIARSLKISCPTVLNGMLENTGMTGAYPTTSPVMNPEPTDLIQWWLMLIICGGKSVA